MKRFRAVARTALVMGTLLIAISGCEKGSAEKAGERIDESVEKISKSLEEASDSIQDVGRAAND